ncbi:MAG: hypothetical protein ACYS30_09670 [Planctomycetota bacterium]
MLVRHVRTAYACTSVVQQIVKHVLKAPALNASMMTLNVRHVRMESVQTMTVCVPVNAMTVVQKVDA